VRARRPLGQLGLLGVTRAVIKLLWVIGPDTVAWADD
jgi:hypothetical protein